MKRIDDSIDNSISSDDLAIEHLQLSARTYNSCLEARCETIGKVRRGFSLGALDHLGKASRKDVENALTTLDDVRDPEGRVNWDRFRKERPLAKDYIAFMSSHLGKLSDEVRAKGLGALHLKKAQTGLNSARIHTVGDLVDAVRRGLRKSDMDSFGALARTETVRALNALNASVADDGEVDWIDFAENCRFKVFPKDAIESLAAKRVLSMLPEICELAVRARFSERDWNIFRQRLLTPRNQRRTLEEIGQFYKITRERVRQIQNSTLKAIKGPIFSDDYSGLEFRLREEFLEFFRNARDHFVALDEPAWTASEWKEELCRLWGFPLGKDLPLEFLLMKLLGYEDWYPQGKDLEPLVIDERTEETERDGWVKTVSEIHRVLRKHLGGIDFFGLASELKKAGARIDDLEDLPKLLELCPTAEVLGEEQARLRFDALKTIADRAFRVLSEHGEPLSRARLMREINARVPKKNHVSNVRTLVNQMTKDPRLEPIQKSGAWTLAEWGLESAPLIDVMVDVLREANEALSSEAIADEVLTKRPGARSSIKLLLTMNPDRFTRVGPTLYALTEWEEGKCFQTWDRESVGEFVEKLFQRAGKDQLPFSEIREELSKATGLGWRSTQGMLIWCPGIRVTGSSGGHSLANFVPEWRSLLSSGGSGRVTQPERIVACAKARLSQVPWGQVALIEIVRHVENTLGVPRPNIYAAISQTDEIETFRVDDKATKACCISGTSPKSYPQLGEIVDSERRKSCTLAISKLHLEEVDMGIFLLGREFDFEMKNLLIAARDFGGLEVKEGHLKRLQNRIDWAIKYEVLEDKETLIHLKEERNDPGHEPPSLAKREKLLEYAPFLAGLYLDNLLKIQEKALSYKNQKKA